jgi:hypothetical protein
MEQAIHIYDILVIKDRKHLQSTGVGKKTVLKLIVRKQCMRMFTELIGFRTESSEGLFSAQQGLIKLLSLHHL